MKKKLVVLLSAAMAAMLFAGCGGGETSGGGTDSSASEEVQGTSTIVIGFNQDISSGLSPFAGFKEVALSYGVYESLFCYGFDSDYVPEIIDTYELAEDGLSMSITIDDDISTANGYPVTTSDVVWSIEQVLAGNNARYASFIDLEKSEIIDDYNMVLAFNSRWIDFNYDSLCHIPVTSQEAYEASPDQFYSQGEGSTGAYKIESYEEGVEITLVKNENYRGSYHEQNVDKIVLKYIPETAQELIAYENGEIDFISNTDVNDLEYLQELEGTYVENAYENRSQMIIFNTVEEGSPVTDARVRKAISYAINNEEITEFVYNGWAYPAVSIVSPLVREWNDEWDDGYDNEYYAYDIDKAKELLAEAGYAEGFDLTFDYETFNESIALVIQEDLAQIGINVNLQAHEEAEYGTLTAVNEGWEMGITQYKVQDTVLFNFYNKVNEQKTNQGGWYDEDFQNLLAETFYTQDEDATQQLIETFEDADPQYNLLYMAFQYAYREGITRKSVGSNLLFPGDWDYDAELTSDWLYD